MNGRVRFALSGLMVSGFALLGSLAQSQTLASDVHITPRQATVNLASAAYSDSFGPGGVIRTSSNLVLVPVTITDERNRPVVGLDQQNFQLFENKKPQEIKHFSNEDTPVSIGILVDTSGSMAYKLQRAREAVLQFCQAANPQDEFFLITFSSEPELTSGFTTNPEDIANGLLSVHPKGKTSLLDAIYMGVEKMRDARYARRAMLILSDGGDNHSRYNERDLKSAIREADIAIYAVGTYDRWVSTQEELLGPELLRNISDMTGGQAFTLNSIAEMSTVTQSIGSRLRHQYVLAYQPESGKNDGKWHKISVKLRLPKKFPFLHVAARPGYYAGGE
jgi:Ca-activated chloride channel family protein